MSVQVRAYHDLHHKFNSIPLSSCSAGEIVRKTTMLDALRMVASSWGQVNESTIRNCFCHGGFSKDSLEEIDQLPVPEDLLKGQYEEWMCINQNVETAPVLTDDELCAHVLADEEKAENDTEDDADLSLSNRCAFYLERNYSSTWKF